MYTKTRINGLPYFLMAVLIIFFLCTHRPNVEYDIDPSYILFGATRPPVYPIFIWLFHWFGQYQFDMVMWTQSAFTFLALMYGRYWLRKNLKIPDFLIYLICLVVLVTIAFHFQIWFIQSEGLSFPLFIFTFFTFIDCFSKFDLKKIVYLSVLVSMLILTRLQFYYLFCLFFMLAIWYLWQRVQIRLVGITALILLSSILFTIIIDHTYHYFKHGFFGGASYSGLMILVQTIYLADSSAARYFQNPTEKSYVQQMIKIRDVQQLNQDASLVTTLKPSYLEHAYQSYSRNYLLIQKIIDDTLKTSIENTTRPFNLTSNSMALNINKVLFLHEVKKNTVFFVWKIINCMGGVPQFLFFLIVLLTLFLKIIREKIRYLDVYLAFVLVTTTITFLNALIIAICNPDLTVYFCYSQFMFYCLAAFLVNLTFIKTTSYDENTTRQPLNKNMKG